MLRQRQLKLHDTALALFPRRSTGTHHEGQENHGRERGRRRPHDESCAIRSGRFVSGLFTLRCGGIPNLEPGVADVTEAIVRILFETAPQQPLNSHRGLFRESAPVRFTLEHLHQSVRRRVAAERRASREHLVQHTPERPDVSLFVHWPPARLLRAHVRGRSDDGPCRSSDGGQRAARVRQFSGAELGEAEIEHFHHAG